MAELKAKQRPVMSFDRDILVPESMDHVTLILVVYIHLSAHTSVF